MRAMYEVNSGEKRTRANERTAFPVLKISLFGENNDELFPERALKPPRPITINGEE
jgi:hypothetical protein